MFCRHGSLLQTPPGRGHAFRNEELGATHATIWLEVTLSKKPGVREISDLFIHAAADKFGTILTAQHLGPPDGDTHPRAVGEFLQKPLPHPRSVTVASATIAFNHQTATTGVAFGTVILPRFAMRLAVCSYPDRIANHRLSFHDNDAESYGCSKRNT